MAGYCASSGCRMTVAGSGAISLLGSAPERHRGALAARIAVARYRVAPENVAAFLRAIHAIERTRRRNGADDWRVLRDIAEQDCFVERYIISSWAEYVRQRSRMTVSDRQLQEQVSKLQHPGVEIRVSRLIGIDPREVAETVSKSSDAD